MGIRSRWADLFGSHEVELPDGPMWRMTTPGAFDGEVELSLHGGDIPKLKIALVDKETGFEVASFKACLSALDAHINELIKHRDLLAQMGEKR